MSEAGPERPPARTAGIRFQAHGEPSLPFYHNKRKCTQPGKLYIIVRMEKDGPLFAWSGPRREHELQDALDAVPLQPWEPPEKAVLPKPRRRSSSYGAPVTIEDWEEERERRARTRAKVAR